MGVPKSAAAVDQEAQDEISEIMSEIESLQRELDEPSEKTVAAGKPKLKAVPSSPSEPAESSMSDVNELGDFHGASGEPSIEETLGELKHEEPASDSLLAQSLTVTGNDDLDEMEAMVDETLDPDVPEELAAYMSDEEEENLEITEEQAEVMAMTARRSIAQEKPIVKETMETAARAFAETTRERPAPKAPGAASTAEEGCLEMTLTGKMTLKLQYEFGGQAVSVGFSDHALRVELSDGTEFKIPIRKNAA